MGKAGLGKGQIIAPVTDLLTYFRKYRDPRASANMNRSAEQIKASAADTTAYMQVAGANPKVKEEGDLLLPMAPDGTTFQALMKRMAQSCSFLAVTHPEYPSGRYMHSSLYFMLEELSSLFHKHSEGVNKFLLKVYDNRDYTNETMGRGLDVIKRPCLSMLGGTTPTYMQEVFKDGLLTDGFASRTIFIFEYANRGTANFVAAEHTIEQKVARVELLLHLHKLTKLFGMCSYEPEALKWLNEWNHAFPTTPRVNSSLKLEGYYARKGLHLAKMAMAIHFSEKTDDMVITLDEILQAEKLLAYAEKKMHFALAFGDRNPLAKGAKAALAYMRGVNRRVELKELVMELNDNFRQEEVGEIMNYLKGTEAVECEITSRTIYYWIKPKVEGEVLA